MAGPDSFDEYLSQVPDEARNGATTRPGSPLRWGPPALPVRNRMVESCSQELEN